MKNPNVKIKIIALSFLFIFYSFVSYAQLKPSSKVFLTFEDTMNEVNVNGEDAKAMLKDYLIGKTSLVIVDSIQNANFVFQLRVIELVMGLRKGKLDVIDNQTKTLIFETKWVKGSGTMYNGYSGSRQVIGVMVKDQLIRTFPEIKK